MRGRRGPWRRRAGRRRSLLPMSETVPDVVQPLGLHHKARGHDGCGADWLGQAGRFHDDGLGELVHAEAAGRLTTG